MLHLWQLVSKGSQAWLVKKQDIAWGGTWIPDYIGAWDNQLTT